MARKFKSPSRPSGFRDSKLIIIATEGTSTEKRYFEDMVSPKFYPNPRVHVHVIEKLTTASSPSHVLRSLDEFKKRYSLGTYDQLWMVIDLDEWKNKELRSVATQCDQKKYNLAVSNPCFEFWLLLHVKSIDEYSQDELLELQKNERMSSGRTRLDRELVKQVGSYSKTDLKTSDYLPFVEKAISRARKLDKNPEYRWPNAIGSRVYLLAEVILELNNDIEK
jgi:hypothetical protein